MPELATAWITLAISADNMQRDIRRELNKVDNGTAKTVGKKMGRELEAGVTDGAKGAANQVRGSLSAQLGADVGAVLGRTIGGGIRGGITVAAKAGELALKGALVGGAGVAAVALGGVGLALTKGFDRLKSIDEAKFKLKALGNDSASIAKIMDSALASVKGTAFGMDDAVTAAASATAAGIQPGKDLTKYLTEVGDAAAIAGSSFSDMGSIFNKIQTSNKAYTDDLQQLSDRGLPIFQWLQKEYGVTGDALSKMVQNGEVDAAHFQHAIETNIGGAAQKMGQSFEGSVQNAQAALGRLGAAFLAPIFGNAAGGIGSITDGLDKMTAWVGAHQPEIITFFTNVGVAAISFAQDVVKSLGNVMQGVGDFTHALGTVVGLFDADKGAALQSAGDKINGIGTALINTANTFDAAKDKVRNWGAAAVEAATNAQNAVGGAVKGIGTQVGALPFKKVIQIDADTAAAESKLHTVGNSIKDLPFKKTVEVEIHGTTTGTALPTVGGVPILKGGLLDSSGDRLPGGGARGPGKAAGGAIFGAGTATSDSIPARLSNGEHVWTAAEVKKAGGQGAMYAMRAAVRGFSGGGAVDSGGMDAWALAHAASGRQYGYGGTGGAGNSGLYDCSGFMSDIYAAITGKPYDGNERYFTTESDFSKLGFVEGFDPNSPFNIGVHNGGGGKNSHMAGTLFGVPVESGGAAGITQLGGTAAGADSKQFQKQYHLPGVYGMPDDAGKPAPDQLGTAQNGGKSFGEELGKGIFSGILQGIGLDGSVFSNPFEWPNVKSVMAGLNFGGSLLQGLGGQDASTGMGGGFDIGGFQVPSLSGLIGPKGPQATNPMGTPASGNGLGPAPGPAPSMVINGNVNMDHRQLTQRADAHQNQVYRRHMSAVRPGG